MSKLSRLPGRIGRYSSLWLCLASLFGFLLLAEVGMRLLFPHFRLSYSEARFSPRYHHASPEFSALLTQIRADPAAFRGDITVAILGDSFVAGDNIDAERRFTSIMQSDYDSLPGPRTKIINLGFTSYSTLLYERLYRDVILSLDPDIVLVCLDQTDAADDYLYEQELSSRLDRTGSAIASSDFADTILKHYESYPSTFFLLRNSRLFLWASTIKQRLTGSGFIPASTRFGVREWEKLRLYLETCSDPESHGNLFENSEKYIRSMSLMKPPRQELCFVTYPRSENLAGQRKTTLLHGVLPNSHASTPYFEYWIRKTDLAARYPNIEVLHTSDEFRAAIASSGRQYYFHVDDVHWNEEGHRLFAQILEERNIAKVRERDANRGR